MNDTILALLSALAIYGLTSFALPRTSGWDNGDDDATVQLEDTADLPPAGDFPDDGPQSS